MKEMSSLVALTNETSLPQLWWNVLLMTHQIKLAVAHSLVSHEMQKKADSHSLDPRKITISHLYASQEQKKIEEFFKFFASLRLKISSSMLACLLDCYIHFDNTHYTVKSQLMLNPEWIQFFAKLTEMLAFDKVKLSKT